MPWSDERIIAAVEADDDPFARFPFDPRDHADVDRFWRTSRRTSVALHAHHPDGWELTLGRTDKGDLVVIASVSGEGRRRIEHARHALAMERRIWQSRTEQ